MKLPFQSIRWRLQAWHGLLLCLVIVAFCMVAYRLAWGNQMRRADRSLHGLEHKLFDELLRGPDGKPMPPDQLLDRLTSGAVALPAGTALLFEGNEPGYAYFSIRDADGKVLLESPNVPGDLDLIAPKEDGFATRMESPGSRLELQRATPKGLRYVVGRDISPELQDMRRLMLSVAAAGLGVWLAGLIGGWWLAGRAIRPINAISSTAARIADGNLAERIDTEGNSELDQLAAVLNQTFQRLHEAFERRRRFTADASHELRTPVTILLAETARMLKRERTTEEYRDALVTCQQTATRMRDLVEALLLLNRQEEARPQLRPINLADLVAEVSGQLAPLASARGIHIQADLAPVTAPVDPAAFSIVVSNLLGNAIHHNREGGHVEVQLSVDGGAAALRIQDDGPGIAPADLPHIFERFYRADKARTGASGHTGLGLSIAKTIVDSHGGQIGVTSTPGEGAIFTVTLPVPTAAAG